MATIEISSEWNCMENQSEFKTKPSNCRQARENMFIVFARENMLTGFARENMPTVFCAGRHIRQKRVKSGKSHGTGVKFGKTV